MKYRILLFDADGTLMDFQKAEAKGLEAALGMHHLPFNAEILALYSAINKGCWEEYEQGLLDRETLLVERFRRLFDRLGIDADAQAVRATYHEELGKGAYMTEGARDLCAQLGKTHDLYIVTNGVSATQRSRFARCGLDRLVKKVFISEDIGVPKPQKAYFERVFAEIPGFSREEALIIGDSLTADIRGGIDAGIATCWYNPGGLAAPEDLRIDYQIRALAELNAILDM